MDTLNERIQSIRIGKNAPEKITTYLKDVGDAMKADLTDQEMEKLESIMAKVVLTAKKPRIKKAKKLTSDTGDPLTPQTPKKPRKLTGYGQFMKETCASLKKEHFSGNYITHISGLWKALSDTEKKEWNEKAREISLAVTFMSGGGGSVSDAGITVMPTPVNRQDTQGLREAVEPSAVESNGSSWGDDADESDESEVDASVGSVDSEVD